MDKTGALYGVSNEGGNGPCFYYGQAASPFPQWHIGCGVVFKLTSPAPGQTIWNETILYSFQSGDDGGFASIASLEATPYTRGTGELVASDLSDGALLGTAPFGGANGAGVLFQLAPPAGGGTTWTESVLFSFAANGETLPVGPLHQDANGALVGATSQLHPYSSPGTTFRLLPPSRSNPNWTEDVLYDFKGGTDGAGPPTAPTFDPSKGRFFGVTSAAGEGGSGTVYSLRRAVGKYRLLLPFRNFRNGAQPEATLTYDKSGNLYGTTKEGGYGFGTVFMIQP
jgi:hypothetical protein